MYVTERAVLKIKELSEDEGIGHFVIRARIIGGGCAGMQYDMYFDDLIEETDEITETNGVKIVVDSVSWQYLDETTIDYVESTYGAGFKFINPSVKGSCGCGSSVSF